MPRQEWGDLKPYEVVQKVHPVIKKQGADVVGKGRCVTERDDGS
jgi:hypothetical protein